MIKNSHKGIKTFEMENTNIFCIRNSSDRSFDMSIEQRTELEEPSTENYTSIDNEGSSKDVLLDETSLTDSKLEKCIEKETDSILYPVESYDCIDTRVLHHRQVKQTMITTETTDIDLDMFVTECDEEIGENDTDISEEIDDCENLDFASEIYKPNEFESDCQNKSLIEKNKTIVDITPNEHILHEINQHDVNEKEHENLSEMGSDSIADRTIQDVDATIHSDDYIETVLDSPNCLVCNKIHSGEQPFKCTECPKNFRHSSSLYKYMRKKQNKVIGNDESDDKDANGIEYEENLEEFIEGSMLDAIPKNVKGSIESITATVDKHMQPTCLLCHRKFSSNNYLKAHMLAHAGERPFKCSLCPMTYTISSHLYRHMRKLHKQSTIRKADKKFSDGGKLIDSISNFKQSPLMDEINGKDAVYANIISQSLNRFKCELCSEMFSSGRDLKHHMIIHKCLLRDHIRNHTGEKTYKCNFCPSQFRNSSTRTKHTRALHKECSIPRCTETNLRGDNKELSGIDKTKNDAKQHTTSSTASNTPKSHEDNCFGNISGRPTCLVCGKTFSTKGHLKEHSRIHTGEKPFKCNFCPARFTHAGSRNKHALGLHRGCFIAKYSKIKLEEKTIKLSGINETKETNEYTANSIATKPSKSHKDDDNEKISNRPTCLVCSKTFSTNTHLREHSRIHTGEKPFKCNFCQKRFRQSSSYKRHTRTSHKECSIPICAETNLEKESNVLSGIDNENNDTKKCITNDTATIQSNKHKYNYIRNISDKPTCLDCGKTFSSEHDLRDHIRIHIGEKPYKCNFCPLRFKHSSTRNKHTRALHKRCSIANCGETSLEKVNSKLSGSDESNNGTKQQIANSAAIEPSTTHNEDNNGMIPYRPKCLVCGKTFSTKGHLKEHTRIHTGEKPYKCNFCPAQFRYSKFRTKHTRALHKGCTITNCRETNLEKENSKMSGIDETNNGLKKQHTANSTAIEPSTTHKEDNNGMNPYRPKCLVCGKTFSTKGHLKEHTRIHTGEKPYKCNFCPAQFRYAKFRTKHTRALHKGRTITNCRETNLEKENSKMSGIDETNNSIEKHTANSTAIEPSTTYKEDNNGMIPFRPKCLVCGKTFSTKGHLKEHTRIHTGEKPYKCNFCPAQFMYSKFRTKHIRALRKGCSIPKCAEIKFSSCSDLEQHKRTHEGGSEKDMSEQKKCAVKIPLRRELCSICGRTFPNLKHLKQHTVIHTGEQPFQCTICPKAFRYSTNLYGHRKFVHTGCSLSQKPVSDMNCNKDGTATDTLKSHEGNYLGNVSGRPTCLVCSKTFSTKGHLKEHSRIHTGEKPFKCDFCPARFTHSSSRNKHAQVLHRGFFIAECAKLKLEENSKLSGINNAKNETNECTANSSSTFPSKTHKGSYIGKIPDIPKCLVCDKTFSLKHYLRKHLRIHTGEKPFKCNFCSKLFRCSSGCSKHIRTLHKGCSTPKYAETNIVQEENGKLSGTDNIASENDVGKNLLENIVEFFDGSSESTSSGKIVSAMGYDDDQNSTITDKFCSICVKMFSSCSDLELHLRLHEKDSNDLDLDRDKFPNPSENCTIPKLFKKVTNDAVNVTSRCLLCSVCGKKFSTPFHLREHLRVHTGERPYKCTMCPATFHYSTCFSRHMKVSHKGCIISDADDLESNTYDKEGCINISRNDTSLKPFERSFQCPICSKILKYSHNLIKHIRTLHKDESEQYIAKNPSHGKMPRKHACFVCGRTFYAKSHLNEHIRIHTGEKPYKCNFCPMRFRYSRGKNNHTRVLHKRCSIPKCAETNLDEENSKMSGSDETNSTLQKVQL